MNDQQEAVLASIAKVCSSGSASGATVRQFLPLVEAVAVLAGVEDEAKPHIDHLAWSAGAGPWPGPRSEAECRWASGSTQPDEVREDGAGVWRDESGLQSVAVSPSLAGAVASVQFTPARPARRRRWWHRKQ